jgi:phage gp36-like protein
MSYCTESDILERFDEEELVELTNDDPNGQNVNSTVITDAIADADSEINGYCQKWYEIPLDPVTNLIKKLSIDISIYNLYSRRPNGAMPEIVKERYDNAVKTLNMISQQKVLLGADTLNPVDAAGSRGHFESNDRIFNRDDMKYY